MKKILPLVYIALTAMHVSAQNVTGSAEDRKSLDNATFAIRQAFLKGDAALVASLHHPNVVKYFGGNNVVTGRAALQKELADWFRVSTVEFVENTIESTVFTGNTAIQTCIFSMKVTPKAGGQPTTNRGRSMVVYVRDSKSPTGWYSLREMAQEAPAKNSP